MVANWQAAWDANKDRLAELVHNAWMKTKLANGFADHVGVISNVTLEACCQLPLSKHHPDMLPFAELSDGIELYDYETALVVFPMAYEIGFDEGAGHILEVKGF